MLFRSPHKAGAEWYGKQNVRFKGGYDIVEADLTGKLYEVKEPTDEYGAMGTFSKSAGLTKSGEHKLDLPAIANELRNRGYSGIKFKDSVSNRIAYAILPEQLKATEKPPQQKLTYRRALIQGHKLAKQLGMTENERRGFMEELTGKTSMKDMTADERRLLINELEQRAVEAGVRSEEHTSELQSHSFISYAVFCLKKKNRKSTRLNSIHIP